MSPMSFMACTKWVPTFCSDLVVGSIRPEMFSRMTSDATNSDRVMEFLSDRAAFRASDDCQVDILSKATRIYLSKHLKVTTAV